MTTHRFSCVDLEHLADELNVLFNRHEQQQHDVVKLEKQLDNIMIRYNAAVTLSLSLSLSFSLSLFLSLSLSFSLSVSQSMLDVCVRR